MQRVSSCQDKTVQTGNGEARRFSGLMKNHETGYRPAVRLMRVLEKDGWGAVVKGADVGDAVKR